MHELICTVTHGREYEVKWALGSITMNKVSGGDGIPIELFQILKYDAVATGLEKVSFHSNPKEGQWQRMLKLPHNFTQFTREWASLVA